MYSVTAHDGTKISAPRDQVSVMRPPIHPLLTMPRRRSHARSMLCVLSHVPAEEKP
jgi:hypothetical protein